MRRVAVALFSMCLITAMAKPQAEPSANLNVVTTLAPLYALTAGVMEGAVTPVALMQNGDNPHHYNMRPGDAQRLMDADMIICTSRKHENYLKPLIRVLPERQHTIVEALATPGLTLLPAANQTESHNHSELGNSFVDMHFWLNPVNAIAYTQYITEELTAADPKNGALYQKNALRQISELRGLDKTIRDLLGNAPRHAQYISYHPALAYFEKHYRIEGGQSLTDNGEAGVGAAAADALYADIESGAIRCLFQEPEFSPRLMQRAAERFEDKVRLVTLDTLGNSYPSESASYQQMLMNIAQEIEACSSPYQGK